MEINKRASAGTMESSDAYVEIEPGTEGIQLQLESVVGQQFGESISQVVRQVLGRQKRRAIVAPALTLRRTQKKAPSVSSSSSNRENPNQKRK